MPDTKSPFANRVAIKTNMATRESHGTTESPLSRHVKSGLMPAKQNRNSRNDTVGSRESLQHLRDPKFKKSPNRKQSQIESLTKIKTASKSESRTTVGRKRSIELSHSGQSKGQLFNAKRQMDRMKKVYIDSVEKQSFAKLMSNADKSLLSRIETGSSHMRNRISKERKK